MKKKSITTTFQVAEQLSELSEIQQTLTQKAVAALKHSYAPYSNFRVGAAILLANGQIVEGSNQENAAYPLCLCAERVALGNALTQYPGETIKAIAVTAIGSRDKIKSPIPPCGSCRQVLSETEDRQQEAIQIILRGQEGANLYYFFRERFIAHIF